MGDGNGWVVCALGHRHWGRFGAAGLLVRADGQVILQHRAPWTHEGGTWGIPGGARDSHEDAVAAAVREADEEAGIAPGSVDAYALLCDDHGGWSYTTVLGRPRALINPYAANAESSAVRWWSIGEVGALPLHHGFAETWPLVEAPDAPLTLVIDAANVVGSRPDGWWRDRPAAGRRLLEQLEPLTTMGIPADRLPNGVQAGALTVLLPAVHVVLEGAAVAVAEDGSALVVHTVNRDGDTEVVQVATDAVSSGDQTVVVTADHGLRGRLPATVTAVGPSWLLQLIEAQPLP